MLTWRRRPERECPWCAETILAKARVCKHCGRDVEAVAESELATSIPLVVAQPRAAPNEDGSDLQRERIRGALTVFAAWASIALVFTAWKSLVFLLPAGQTEVTAATLTAFRGIEIDLCSMAAILFGLVLLFRRSGSAPGYWSLILVVGVATTLYEVGLAGLVGADGNVQTVFMLCSLFQAVTALCWAVYWFRSKRVLATFGTKGLGLGRRRRDGRSSMAAGERHRADEA